MAEGSLGGPAASQDMETLIAHWNLSWGVDRYPIYSHMELSYAECMTEITVIANLETHRNVLGIYDPDTHRCRIVIFPEKP